MSKTRKTKQWPEPTRWMLFRANTAEGKNQAQALIRAAADGTVPASDAQTVLALVELLEGLVGDVMTYCGSIQQNVRRLMKPTESLLVLDRDLEQLKVQAVDAHTAMHNVIGSRFAVGVGEDVPGLGTIMGLPIGEDDQPPLDDR